MWISLNKAEQKLADYLARARHLANRKGDVVNAKMGPQSDYQTDLDGVGAEIAFAKYTNSYPDLDIGSWDDCDVYTPVLGGVDVKTTPYKNGHLLARLNKKDKAVDAYALMIGKMPNYRFAGWVPAETLIDDKNIVDLGHGEGYGLKQHQLIGAI